MKFNVPSKTLHTAASAVSKVINSKNALTILNNFLITLQGDTLTVTGSDTENALTARVPVTDAEGEGSFCIDARRLVDLLKEMPDQGIVFNINDDNMEVEISYSSGKYNLVALRGDDFPEYQKSEDDTAEPITFSCPAQQLIKGLDHTLFAVSNDDYRPQMQGVFFDIKPENITFVATDTRKLVKYVNSMSAPGVTASCIMPVKPATVLKNVFTKSDELMVTMTSKSATIESDTFTFNCRFLKGQFPDYERVIPKNNPYTLTVDRLRFVNAVRRVGVFVDPGFGLEKFRISPERVELRSSDPGMNTSARDSVQCSFDGPELVIGFSAIYLEEICSILPTDEITVSLSDPSRPGVFRPIEDEENSELLMLLMPMTVGDF